MTDRFCFFPAKHQNLPPPPIFFFFYSVGAQRLTGSKGVGTYEARLPAFSLVVIRQLQNGHGRSCDKSGGLGCLFCRG